MSQKCSVEPSVNCVQTWKPFSAQELLTTEEGLAVAREHRSDVGSGPEESGALEGNSPWTWLLLEEEFKSALEFCVGESPVGQAMWPHRRRGS